MESACVYVCVGGCSYTCGGIENVPSLHHQPVLVWGPRPGPCRLRPLHYWIFPENEGTVEDLGQGLTPRARGPSCEALNRTFEHARSSRFATEGPVSRRKRVRGTCRCLSSPGGDIWTNKDYHSQIGTLTPQTCSSFLSHYIIVGVNWSLYLLTLSFFRP